MSDALPIERSTVTKVLFEHLRTSLEAQSVLVGRGVAPAEGGWTGGQAGIGEWVDYVVLKTGEAVTPAPGEPERLGPRRTSWALTYQLSYHSPRESLADTLGDKVRAAIVTFPRELSAGDVGWTVQSLTIPRLGGSVRDDTEDPAHWSITDLVSLHLSRTTPR